MSNAKKKAKGTAEETPEVEAAAETAAPVQETPEVEAAAEEYNPARLITPQEACSYHGTHD